MSATDDLIASNSAYAERFDKGDLARAPSKKVAVVACMDARLDPTRALGLDEGDAHVIRNAGGVITETEIRDLAISQHLLGTEEIVVVQHTDCGLQGLDEQAFADRVEEACGSRPDWHVHSFDDLDENLRDSLRAITESPFIPHKSSVRGFVYDVKTGRLREVT